MDYKQRENFSSVQEVVEHNTVEGIREEETREYFLDFGEIPNMIKDHQGKISAISDYDVDGVCCSMILDLILYYLGKDYEIYVPRRQSDGYGLSEGILEKISGTMIITVDNGIVAFDAVKKAKEQGRSVVILDHHLPKMEGDQILLPDADQIIDLEAGQGKADSDHYCGAGVAYKLLCEIIPDPTIQRYALVYAAIATIADVMPLRYDNRKIVKEGLEILNQKKLLPPALDHLLYKTYARNVTEGDIGFKIAPIINAMGRLYDNGGQACYGILKLQDINQIRPYIDHMVEVNKKRQEITKEKTKIAKELLSEMKQIPIPIILYLEQIPEGVVGLIAGKLSEDYQCPAIVLTDTKDSNIIKGSGRNDWEFNLKELLDQCSDHLVKYGGHAQAAGLSLKKEDLKAFQTDMEEKIKPYIPEPEHKRYYDLEIEDLEEIPYYYEELRKYGPYGNGNPEPVFYIPNYTIVPDRNGYYETFGSEDEHIRFQGYMGKVVGFHFAQKYIEAGCPLKVDIIGKISERVFWYQGKEERYFQIQMEDFWKSENVIPKTNLARKLQTMAKERER